MTGSQTPFRALRKLSITVVLAIAMTAILWLARRGVETYVVPAEKHSSWRSLTAAHCSGKHSHDQDNRGTREVWQQYAVARDHSREVRGTHGFE
jgi:hypothetical protein